MREVVALEVTVGCVNGSLPPPEPQAAPADCTTPAVVICRQFVAVTLRPETVRFVVDAVPFTVKRAPGFVVPTPTLPALVIMNDVALEEPTTNWFDAPPAVGFTESVAHGEVVQTPTLPPVLARRRFP